MAAQRPQAFKLFARNGRVVAAHEFVFGPLDDKCIVGKIAIAARVHRARVLAGLACCHPLGQNLPRTAAPSKANGRPACQPDIGRT